MSVINSEFKVSSSLPADKLFKLCLDFDTLAPKIQPQTFKAIDLIEGDGGVGSIKTTTYDDAVPYTSAKYKIDALTQTTLALPTRLLKDNVVLKRNAKPTEETLNQFKELFKNTFKAHEA
nr:root allergen protein-like [Tanacetum cinerariifolium]